MHRTLARYLVSPLLVRVVLVVAAAIRLAVLFDRLALIRSA